MKSKTKKKLKQFVLYLLVIVFVLGTILLYLPVSNTPQNNPPPLNQLQNIPQNNPPPAQPPTQ